MKNLKVILFLLAVLSSFFCASQIIKDDLLLNEILNGKIKSFTETSFEGTKNFVQSQNPGILYQSKYVFDKKGRVVEFKQYNSDSSLSSKVAIKYDANDNMIEKMYYDQAADDSIFEKNIFKYDSKGKIIEVIHHFGVESAPPSEKLVEKNTYKYDPFGNILENNTYSMGKISGRKTYKYDSKNNIKELNMYDKKSILTTKIVYTYDTYGIASEETNYNSKGTWNNKSTNRYNSKGDLIETITKYPNGHYMGSRNTYNYDNKGKILEKNSYSPDTSRELFEKHTYKYDSVGTVIEENKYTSNGLKLISEFTIKYDTKGHKIEDTHYDTIGNLRDKTIYMYHFDQVGNWITKIIVDKNNISSSVIRKIEYY